MCSSDLFYHLMLNLPAERLGIAIHAVAQSRRALELTRQYAAERKAFGSPIGSFQVNRHAIAEMTVKLDIMQNGNRHDLSSDPLHFSVGSPLFPNAPREQL